MKYFKVIMILLIGIITISTAGCTYHNGIRIQGSFSSSNKIMEAKFSKMSGEDIKEIKLDAGQNVVFDYQLLIKGFEAKGDYRMTWEIK